MALPIHRTYAQDFIKQHVTIKSTYKGPELEVQHACLTLVAAALIVGPDEFALQKFTGFSASFIETGSHRMHASCLWKGEKSEADEWGNTREDFMNVVFAHASVAKGVAIREITVGKIKYTDVYISEEVANYFSSLFGEPN